MEKDYYKNIGFMCGLEIHQRLQTNEKLFCSCATNISKEEQVGSIKRRQRAVAGELGTIDRSAEFEEGKERTFVYKISRKCTCLVDVDEEPPHEMNLDALGITLSIAKAMGMKIVDELQPMRKGVVDGSDPSAFQRTALVALDGKIKVSSSIISVPSLFLEEESSGIAASGDSSATYETSRLGIPLIEIDTDPYISTPTEAKEVALYLGTLLRVTGRVQRGIGSIRQDVNMSIKGGARVEIKGMQELWLIDKFIENEIKRQQELIKIRDELKKGKAKVHKQRDLTKLFAGSKAKILGSAKYVSGFRLEGFNGFLGREVNPQRRLGTEISDYARAAGVRGLIHSDEDLTKYGINAEEINKVRKALDLAKNDAFILIGGDKESTERAIKAAAWRAEYSLEGIPKETRNPEELCTSRFLRPLPGGSRMYPETDVRTIAITTEMLKNASDTAPDLEKERKNIGALIKNKEIADQLLISARLPLFKEVLAKTKADPEFVANILIQKFTELRRDGYDCDMIDNDRVCEMFGAYASGIVTKQGIEIVLKELAKADTKVNEIIKAKGLARIRGKELEAIVTEASKSNKGPDISRAIMTRYRLVVDGKELNDVVAKATK